MICPECKAPIKEKDNFCPKCGNKIKPVCSWCWVKKKDNYNCGENSCPGWKTLIPKTQATSTSKET